MNVGEWLKLSSERLADAMAPSARLDAEVILAHTVNKHRTWLHAHPEAELDPRRVDIADARIELRLERVPVAYIIGHKEFYGRRFYVSPDTLIPRPESEALVKLALNWCQKNPTARQLVDVGTGSGCLGITIGLECPDMRVTLSDIDKKALRIAEKNAAAHKLNCQVLQSNLLDSYPLKADIIVANLPYVDRSWQTGEDIKHEPDQALYADDGGLKLIRELILSASQAMNKPSALVLEADPEQHTAIINLATEVGLKHSATDDYGLLFEFKD